ncbi:MAG: hypothetical protein KAH18_09915 [Psychromonas sp.]|nr:hypothetical protein [Psychromonas sp.]
MVLPLHNRYCQHVGWIMPDEYIYDPKMVSVAYISDRNAWAIDGSHWLGPMNKLTCLDHLGKPVAWNDNDVQGYTHPSRPQFMGVHCASPARPCLPSQPMLPNPAIRPTTGWSALSFIEWCSQKDKPEDRKMDPLQIRLAERRKKFADGSIDLAKGYSELKGTRDKISLKK